MNLKRLFLCRKTIDQYRVRAGTSRHGSDGHVSLLEWQKPHPVFTKETMDADVAVLKLVDKITFGPTMQPIKLTSAQPRQGQMLTVTGWGVLVRPTVL